jgi:3-deoxy-7-phosphoheptulonate synthase
MLVQIGTGADSTRQHILHLAAERNMLASVMDSGEGGQVISVGGSLEEDIASLPGVLRVLMKHQPFAMASLEARERSTVTVGDVVIGGKRPVMIAGPCSVEGRDAIIEQARLAQVAGANLLRGGAFKPRTSPYSFQGHGELGLQMLVDAREATGLPIVTEVMEPDQVELVSGYADMLQVGSRNMANFSLLKACGRSSKPVLLKRGFSATLEEFLMSAEYIMAHGNPNVVLCERGIRTADSAFRFNLDLNIVPGVRAVSHLPIIVDPSHGTGRRELVHRMALAGIAAGADGLAIEVHPDPDNALSDGMQTITPAELQRIVHRVAALSAVLAATEDELLDITPLANIEASA